ncbi:UGP1 [Symbiodinium natans]|uniref:UGP1 protein n=1 Tax=Symbiodinium natans TaxID=878477 RepID=A0A812TC34_9DINO|nr:UGP1 [Symbiodinium natans]
MHVPKQAGELNVILRSYEPGDWLGRHVDDVRMFGEPVLAAILQPGGARDGLRFSLPSDVAGLRAAVHDAEEAHAAPLHLQSLEESENGEAAVRQYQVLERVGTVLCMEREARFLYGHEVPKVSCPRVSMTWRWLHPRFQAEVDEVRGLRAFSGLRLDTYTDVESHSICHGWCGIRSLPRKLRTSRHVVPVAWRYVEMFVHPGAHLRKQREEIHAELVKEGIESPPPLPVNDGDPSEANEDLFDKLAGTEGLKGKTENQEACLCLPGTLHLPESQKKMSGDAEESERGLLTFLGTKWHRENGRVNSHINPLFDKYEKEKITFDKLLDDLHAKASAAESAATTLKEAFHKVQVAHEEGNCQRATAAAEANFQEVPQCKSDLDQASADMTVHLDHAQPSCKRGAVALQAPLVAPQFFPLPGPDVDLKGKAILGATLPDHPLPAVPEAVFQPGKQVAASRATCGRPGEPPNQVCLLVSNDLEGFLPYRLLVSEAKGLAFASATPAPDFSLDPADIIQVQRLPREAWQDDRPFSELRRRIEARKDLQSSADWSVQDRLWPPYFHLIHLMARNLGEPLHHVANRAALLVSFI